jgi:hypothetical protein
MRYLLCACLGLLVGLAIGAGIGHRPVETAALKLRQEALQRTTPTLEHASAEPRVMPPAVASDPTPEPAPASAEPRSSDLETTGSASEKPPQQVQQASRPEQSIPSRISSNAAEQLTTPQPHPTQSLPPVVPLNPPQKVAPFRMSAEDLQRAR